MDKPSADKATVNVTPPHPQDVDPAPPDLVAPNDVITSDQPKPTMEVEQGAVGDADEDEEEMDEDEDIPEDEMATQRIPVTVVRQIPQDEPGDKSAEDDPEQEDPKPPNLDPSEVGPEQNGHMSDIMTRKRAASLTTNEGPRPKLVRNASPSPAESCSEGVLDDDGEHDQYCWACHKLEVHIRCRICPRSYHTKCMQHDSPETKIEDGICICPECVVVMKAENVNHRSDAMQLLSIDQLSSMLKYICGRMKGMPGADPFLRPVSQDDAEDYFEYVKVPMDIAKLETNIKDRQYGSTEAFLADVQWIVHNSIIFNTASSPYSAAAKRLLKVCRQELSEIETCPECYTNAHTKEDWFIEACKRPHILVWAKLKGFPYWPAKAMKVKDDQVDVRFFGQHDRAWVNVKDCYLYSLEQPNAGPKRSAALTAAVDELNQHVGKLKVAFGEVAFVEGKVVMDGALGVDQIQRLLPQYTPQEPSQVRGSTQVNPSKVAPASGGTTPVGKVVMTISSLKTSPTVVSNTAVAETPAESPSSTSGSDSSEGHAEVNQEENPEEASSEGEAEGEPEGEAEVEPAPEIEQKPSVAKEKVEIEVKKREKTEIDTGASEKEEHERQRVPSGILASALGLRRVVKRPVDEEVKSEGVPDKPVQVVRKSLRRVSNASSNDGKSDSGKSGKGDKAIKDIGESEPIRIKAEFQLKRQSKAQDLMDQISSQAQTKPGYRFNISKDISISAIGSSDGESSIKSQNNGTNKVRRVIRTVNTTDRPIRPTMGKVVAKPGTPTMQVQIQQMTGGKGQPIHAGQLQRMPHISKNVHGGVRPVRPIGHDRMGGNQTSMVRPTLTVKSEPQLPVPSVSTTLQMTTAQSISGAITLPGGTITVTPLTPLIAGIPVTPTALSSYTSPATVNLNGQGAVNGLPALVPSKSGQLAQAVVRRTGTVTLPNSVATHMQQCSKGINDLLKTTVEQIAFDILDGGSVAGKIDVQVAQKEKEALVVKHAKEIADLCHSNEIAMRELRVSLENEKRRSVIETKRQCEQEKIRAVEEAKKKQWCARCQREAQFYCCWNTSYCGYHCQEQHWPQHMNICNQNKGTGNPTDDSGVGNEN